MLSALPNLTQATHRLPPGPPPTERKPKMPMGEPTPLIVADGTEYQIDREVERIDIDEESATLILRLARAAGTSGHKVAAIHIRANKAVLDRLSKGEAA